MELGVRGKSKGGSAVARSWKAMSQMVDQGWLRGSAVEYHVDD
jgi:hypothetical protein